MLARPPSLKSPHLGRTSRLDSSVARRKVLRCLHAGPRLPPGRLPSRAIPRPLLRHRRRRRLILYHLVVTRRQWPRQARVRVHSHAGRNWIGAPACAYWGVPIPKLLPFSCAWLGEAAPQVSASAVVNFDIRTVLLRPPHTVALPDPGVLVRTIDAPPVSLQPPERAGRARSPAAGAPSQAPAVGPDGGVRHGWIGVPLSPLPSPLGTRRTITARSERTESTHWRRRRVSSTPLSPSVPFPRALPQPFICLSVHHRPALQP